jgi:RNA polymerase sigma-70 factor (ECF subfamily)
MMLMAEAREAPDGLLAERARDGDRDAFARLVERHYDFIYRVAFRLTGRREDAEDVAQDVCARLGRAVKSYRGGAAFTTWLYALTMNAARDGLRKNKRESARTEAFGTHALVMGEGEPEPDDGPERLWEAVRTLPDKQREAVTLVYGEGMSHAEAAEVMAVAEPTVSWHVHEAKKRLKSALLGRARGE